MTYYNLQTIEDLIRVKKDVNFVVKKTSSYKFYKKFMNQPLQWHRWNDLIENFFSNKSSYTKQDLALIKYKTLLDLYFILIKDKHIKDPISVQYFRNEYPEIQPGLKRMLFMPYLPDQEILYFEFYPIGRNINKDKSIHFTSDHLMIEKMLNENIIAQVRMKDCFDYSLSSEDSIEIYLDGDTLYYNDLAILKKTHNWEICLPNLMEEK